MKFYAIKNGRGEWYDWNDREFWPKDACAFATIGNHEDAERMATEKGGHVVELVEAQAKIVVSQEEDKVLKKAKDTTVWRPAAVISEYAYNAAKDSDQEASLEDRLMRAYVNGWTVEKPKQWNVKVPHSTDGYYWRGISGQVHTYTEPDQHAHVLKTEAYAWTQEQINDAELQDCEKVEVTDDEQ